MDGLLNMDRQETVDDCVDILASLETPEFITAVVRGSLGKVWFLSIDRDGAIAKLALKEYTSVCVDEFDQRYLCTL